MKDKKYEELGKDELERMAISIHLVDLAYNEKYISEGQGGINTTFKRAKIMDNLKTCEREEILKVFDDAPDRFTDLTRERLLTILEKIFKPSSPQLS